ncbi:hypothetical protein BUALT_Bualt18G0016600 [Buddleja alternifolia]|uniref:AFG1-like ATPase n=1 Tax=Buddleja alternifolia TaxID=168488 RepID=A0AAV6WB61_9LAMI|nr:hypothetical protein BUALT_Bualt18G0016600 [Buddleja alternifolia]
MRANVPFAKHFRSIFTYRITVIIFNKNVKSRNIWLGNIHGMARNSAEDFQSRQSFNLISRYLFTDAVNQVSEVKRGGPLVEYERRIAAGKLAKGDASQVVTLRELERLYEKLVENSDACKLDQNAVPAKAGRSLEDPLEAVSLEICKRSILLCLDEFMVPDIAVALILDRLFSHLFSNGVILIATSNRAPENLYQGGLQKDLFLPFVATLKERCLVHEIGSPVDYRKLFSVPLGANGCAYFNFEELCNRPLGAADYSALFNNFHSLALEGVPIFGQHNSPAAYRFVTLVDVMYDNKAILLCTAEGKPLELFKMIVTTSQAHNYNSESFPDLCVDNKLAFAKELTFSRLTEMNSRKYLDLHATMLTAKDNATEGT